MDGMGGMDGISHICIHPCIHSFNPTPTHSRTHHGLEPPCAGQRVEAPGLAHALLMQPLRLGPPRLLALHLLRLGPFPRLGCLVSRVYVSQVA